MGGQILDVEGENLLVQETLLEQLVHARNIDLLFDLQFVMVGEVERQRHVGFPHAALHVVHGQGVDVLFFQGFRGVFGPILEGVVIGDLVFVCEFYRFLFALFQGCINPAAVLDVADPGCDRVAALAV